MMDLDTASKIALIGIAISSLLAVVGIYLNFSAVRKNNRIIVSTKLAEGYKLLSDELIALCRSYPMYKRDLKEAEAHPESEARTKKISVLNTLIENNLKRQEEIDEHTQEIERLFSKLDKVDPGMIDAAISRSYRMQSLAKSSLELNQELKNKNA